MKNTRHNPNIRQLIALAEKLESLIDRVVFVGGCITDLLITDPAAAPARPTLDVDAIVALSSYFEFSALENELRRLGFDQPHVEGAPICRWTLGSLTFDLMPTNSSILGFTNRWYQPAFEHAQRARIENLEISFITAPYFLATKLEAFHGRGKNDFHSHDLEDIIAVIDGRPELVAEVHASRPDLRNYLNDEVAQLLANPNFLEAFPGHLLPDAASQQRLGLVLDRMRQLLSNV